jgi:hypothetical protein
MCFENKSQKLSHSFWFLQTILQLKELVPVLGRKVHCEPAGAHLGPEPYSNKLSHTVGLKPKNEGKGLGVYTDRN